MLCSACASHGAISTGYASAVAAAERLSPFHLLLGENPSPNAVESMSSVPYVNNSLIFPMVLATAVSTKKK